MNIIAPPIAETLCTGLQLAAEKQMRGKLWRVEFYASGARILCDGAHYRVRATAMPDYVEKFVRDVRINYVEPLRAMAPRGD